jgi:hypothetical protein
MPRLYTKSSLVQIIGTPLPKAKEEVVARVMTIVNSDLTMRNYADAHRVESTPWSLSNHPLDG